MPAGIVPWLTLHWFLSLISVVPLGRCSDTILARKGDGLANASWVYCFFNTTMTWAWEVGRVTTTNCPFSGSNRTLPNFPLSSHLQPSKENRCESVTPPGASGAIMVGSVELWCDVFKWPSEQRGLNFTGNRQETLLTAYRFVLSTKPTIRPILPCVATSE